MAPNNSTFCYDIQSRIQELKQDLIENINQRYRFMQCVNKKRKEITEIDEEIAKIKREKDVLDPNVGVDIHSLMWKQIYIERLIGIYRMHLSENAEEKRDILKKLFELDNMT